MHSDPERFVRRLLNWFVKVRRDLPWRKNRSPYSVLISEIMLQQTVVKTVIPYYNRWLKKYPDVHALARASESEVLKSWEGLGYYSRARNLLKTARMIAGSAGGGGRIPDDYQTLVGLPGIGDYTASAILSIAYGRPYPVLDANVKRVMMRLTAVLQWSGAVEKRTRQILAGLIPARRAGAFNEAMMELGATVCSSSNPSCCDCPVSGFCRAFELGRQSEIPAPRKRDITKLASNLLLITSSREPRFADQASLCSASLRVLIRRKTSGLFRGLWGFPLIERRGNPSSNTGVPNRQACIRPAREIVHMTGSALEFLGELSPVKHHYTRFQETLFPQIFFVRTPISSNRQARSDRNMKWIDLDHLHRYPFPSPYRKIISSLREKMARPVRA